MASTPGGSSGGSRSWPLFVALGLAFALVFAILPNPFRLPSDEPTTAAEFAPVPGKSDSNQAGSFSSVGFAEGGEGFAPPTPPPPAPEVGEDLNDFKNRPAQTRCVLHDDGVLRQTEDPLSPRCVNHFPGDNQGSTAQGVNGNEVNVILYNDLNIQGDMSAAYESSQEQTCAVEFECRNLVRTIKAHWRYHQNRYQTYGRVVHVFAEKARCSGDSCTDQAREGDALTILNKYKDRGGIFAVIFLGDNAGKFWDKMAENKVAVFGANFSAPKSLYDKSKPYVWSFFPDRELETQHSAGFLCRKMWNRPARFAPDDDLRGQKRKFGLIYEVSKGDLQPQVAADILVDEVEKQCGMTFAETRSYIEPQGNADSGDVVDSTSFIAQMSQAGVTSIVCYCLPGRAVSGMQNAASSADYYPEWFWDQASAMDRIIWQDLYWSKEHVNLGVTYFWRQPAFREQFHYRAYQEEEPGTTPNMRFNSRIYWLYQNLYSGIQGAGPVLNAGWAEKGMTTFEYRRDPAFPWVPHGGYGDEGPSPYTFIETAQGFWRDPQGTPPDGKPNTGCMRVIQEGYRFTQHTWTEGDADLDDILDRFDRNQTPDRDPCTDDIYKLEDPQAGDGP